MWLVVVPSQPFHLHFQLIINFNLNLTQPCRLLWFAPPRTHIKQRIDNFYSHHYTFSTPLTYLPSLLYSNQFYSLSVELFTMATSGSQDPLDVLQLMVNEVVRIPLTITFKYPD